METTEVGITIDDLMALFGWRKGVRYGKFERIKIDAENAWREGVNADANPYKEGSIEYSCWYSQWLLCNKNC